MSAPIAMLIVSICLAMGALLAPRFARRVPNREPAHEYGARTADKTWVQFRVRYAVLALLFMAFDMEMVFMFPWAVVYRREGIVAFADMFVFIAILASALAFAWKEGALDWER
jgi:NADH:ubiquinone oxidoreductase subunit 3 (subunit A)